MLKELDTKVSLQGTQLSVFLLPQRTADRLKHLTFLVFRIIRPKWLIPDLLHHDKVCVTQTKTGVELSIFGIIGRM